MPSFTIPNAMAIVKSSAKPILVDVDLHTWNIKIEDIEKNYKKNKVFNDTSYLWFS